MILLGTRKYEGLLQGYFLDPQTQQRPQMLDGKNL